MSTDASLPPGPRAPSAVQTAVWFRRAQWLLGEGARRFGETFTLKILHEGSWVVLSNPEHVKQVFTGDPRVFHAGEGNRILLPVLGARCCSSTSSPTCASASSCWRHFTASA